MLSRNGGYSRTMESKGEGNPLFLASAAFLAAGLVAALLVLVNGSLADAWDDVLPLLFAIAAITGLGGWYRQTRAGDDASRAGRRSATGCGRRPRSATAS